MHGEQGPAAQQTLGWSMVIIGVLMVLNIVLGWPAGLQYLWGALAIIVGLWALAG